MNLDEVARELASRKFSFITADDWALERDHPDACDELTSSWDRLVTDHYMKNGDRYRQRRFCKYRVDASTLSFEELEGSVFYQAPEINSYAGGLAREFAPVEPAIRRNEALQATIRFCLQAIERSLGDPKATWRVFVHQFRIHCSNSVTGQPTPEGMHRDGHEFISMHLMDRVAIDGGVSTIADPQGHLLLSVTLKDRMDSFLVDDRALVHGVSPITPFDAEAGHRDMLVIDYNREN
jgi:hypothetical protein